MPAVLIMTMPEGVDRQWMHAVREQIGVQDNPPDGLIVHTESEVDGRVRVGDVWESKDAHERFAEQRLGPAIQAVSARMGVDMSSGPQPVATFYETFAVVRPAVAPAHA